MANIQVSPPPPPTTQTCTVHCTLQLYTNARGCVIHCFGNIINDRRPQLATIVQFTRRPSLYIPPPFLCAILLFPFLFSVFPFCALFPSITVLSILRLCLLLLPSVPATPIPSLITSSSSRPSLLMYPFPVYPLPSPPSVS
jgi:hypothetical protein